MTAATAMLPADDYAIDQLTANQPADSEQPLRLHIGGHAPKEGWKILNVQPGPHVDYVGNCTDLSQFADGSVAEVYASHVFEHLAYMQELPPTLRDINRILTPTGSLYISVPDMECLMKLFVQPEIGFTDRFMIMRMMFGGQVDAYDYHKVGLTFEFLCHFLAHAGFPFATRVPEHRIFQDTSSLRFLGQLISLNVVAHKSNPSP